MKRIKGAAAAEIPGWFSAVDQALFRWFLERADGDLAEIGTYLGSSAVVIGEYVRPDETFTVIDLFDDPAPDSANATENAAEYAGLTRAAFESNYQRRLGTLPVVVQGPSSSLSQHASHGTHRFVHVDGSHRYDHVREDIATARLLLSEAGVVVLDDITSSHTPGVWAATWEAVITGALVPILVSPNKLYGTWGDAVSWQARFKQEVPEGLAWEEQDVLGRPLVRVMAVAGPRPSARGRLRERLENVWSRRLHRRGDRR